MQCKRWYVWILLQLMNNESNTTKYFQFQRHLLLPISTDGAGTGTGNISKLENISRSNLFGEDPSFQLRNPYILRRERITVLVWWRWRGDVGKTYTQYWLKSLVMNIIASQHQVLQLNEFSAQAVRC